MPRGTTTRTVHIGLPTRAAEFGRHRQFGATAESAGARQRARLRRESRRIPVHMTVLMRHRQALCPHREAQIGSAYHIIENASWTDSSPLSRIGIASTTTASASPSTPSCRSSRSCATSSRRTTGSPPAAGTSPTPPRGPTTWSMDVGGARRGPHRPGGDAPTGPLRRAAALLRHPPVVRGGELAGTGAKSYTAGADDEPGGR